jgi:hypothetical protein
MNAAVDPWYGIAEVQENEGINLRQGQQLKAVYVGCVSRELTTQQNFSFEIIIIMCIIGGKE